MEKFTPPEDNGQPGWVTTTDGRRAYRYTADSDLIYDKAPESDGSARPVEGVVPQQNYGD